MIETIEQIEDIKIYKPSREDEEKGHTKIDQLSGLLVWEASRDLTRYLSKLDLAGKHVLEIGCGQGLPGIMALRRGASSAHFLDASTSVLAQTKRNVELNGFSASYSDGDWAEILSSVSEVDLILSSETIYKEENYETLLNYVLLKLKDEGVALFSAKRYYFGVGGGTTGFRFFCQEKCADLQIEVVETIEDGRSNTREILRIIKGRSGSS